MAGIRESYDFSVTPSAEIDLSLNHDRFKALPRDNAKEHFSQLGKMLRSLGIAIYEKLPPEMGRDNNAFQKYLLQLAHLSETLVLKNTIDGMELNADVIPTNHIVQRESGFPLFVRDFFFLRSEAEKAHVTLAGIPDENVLVDHAIQSVFRGVFPSDIVKEKLRRDYYTRLVEHRVPEPKMNYPRLLLNEEGDFKHYLKCIERLDDHGNIPRFYATYLRIPQKSVESEGVRRDLDHVIKSVFASSIVNLELPKLAREIDAINGIQLQMIERYDIGPFYSWHTENSADITSLLESGNKRDSIIMLQKQFVVRRGEKEIGGWDGLWRGFTTGDNLKAEFTPQLSTPIYALMPHTMIQQAYATKVSLGKSVQMIGLDANGRVI